MCNLSVECVIWDSIELVGFKIFGKYFNNDIGMFD